MEGQEVGMNTEKGKNKILALTKYSCQSSLNGPTAAIQTVVYNEKLKSVI